MHNYIQNSIKILKVNWIFSDIKELPNYYFNVIIA